MHPMLNIALRAVRKAGNLIIRCYETLKNIKNSQKNNSNITIDINNAIKSSIIKTILQSYPKHIIITEENNGYKDDNYNVQWIINPLDGANNFKNCLPHFAISIAVRNKNHTEIAVVYDPIRNEMFTATRGQGAQLNGYRLRRNNNNYDLNDAIIATNFSLKKEEHRDFYINIFSKLLKEYYNFRVIGSHALDLVYVAAGRISVYFEVDVNPINFIAGELIAIESGAIVCDLKGNFNHMKIGNIIVGNQKVIKKILANIKLYIS